MQIPPESGVGMRIEYGLQQPTSWVPNPPYEQHRHAVENPGGPHENPVLVHMDGAVPSHSSLG